MMAVPHIGFILAAYGVTAVVLGGIVTAILIDRRSLARALETLEERAGRGRERRPGAPR